MEEKKPSTANEDIIDEMSRIDWNSVDPADAEAFSYATYALTDSLQKLMNIIAVKRARAHFVIALVAASLLVTSHIISANIAFVLLIVLSCAMWLVSKGTEMLAVNDSQRAAGEVNRIIRQLQKKL